MDAGVLAAALLAGCGTAVPVQPSDAVASNSRATPKGAIRSSNLVTPWMTLSGARLGMGIEALAVAPGQQIANPMTPFIFPTAVAAVGNDVYVVDSGRNAVYRYDLTLDAMVQLRGVPSMPGTQLHAMSDHSIYAIDPMSRRVLHFTRQGQLLQTLGDENLGRPVDVTVDQARGLVLVADGLYNQIVVFHLLGRASFPVIPRGDGDKRLLSIGAIAAGGRGIYVTDPLCRCAGLVSPAGGFLTTFGHNLLKQPGAIAVDRYERVFVVDKFDNTVKVFLRGALIADLPAAAMGVRQINDIWINEGWIELADGQGARVEIGRIALPPRD